MKEKGVACIQDVVFMNSTCFSLVWIFFRACMSIILLYKKHVTLNLLQDNFGHWSQGLKASMQDPKMQVAVDKKKRQLVWCLIWIMDLTHCLLFSRCTRTIKWSQSKTNTLKLATTGSSCRGSPFPAWRPYVRSTVTCWNTCRKSANRWFSSVRTLAR